MNNRVLLMLVRQLGKSGRAETVFAALRLFEGVGPSKSAKAFVGLWRGYRGRLFATACVTRQ